MIILCFVLLLNIIPLLLTQNSTNAVDTNCNTFIGSACAACNNGYELYYGWCWPSDINCLILAQDGCAVCNTGFQLVQGWCYYADIKCQNFTALGDCSVCKPNFSFF